MSTTTADTLIIGAGPAGLYAAFTLGLQGIKTHIVDALPHVGGQCTQLFADKTIYDIPAIHACTGQELTKLLLQQAQPFAPVLHLHKQVTGFTFDTTASTPLFTVSLDDSSTLLARSIIIASGTGAFLPKKINLENAALIEKQQLFYHPPGNIINSPAFKEKHIIISGDQETALQAAYQLATLKPYTPARVTLIHRRDKFRAEDNSIALIQQLRSQGSLDFIAGQVTQLHLDEKSKRLTSLSIQQSINQERTTLPADMVFILHGLSPQANNFSDWGLTVQDKHLLIDTATFQTNVPGIFAIGDVVTYPGKRQLIVSAFHEAALASYAIASYLQGGKPVPQLYTTSSSRLQELLGTK